MTKFQKYLIIIGLLVVVGFSANAQKITRQEYINMYKDLAIKKMQLHGIPASITLAQGILESNSGNSTLARQANNHFGIKCHKGWTGETMYRTDDLPDECFRKYKSAEGSYEDHSLFLRGYSRYAFLFDLEPTDYEAWSKGLKTAGYATAPTYAEMLIKVIEECQLYKFDLGVDIEVESPNKGKEEEYGVINEKGKIETTESFEKRKQTEDLEARIREHNQNIANNRKAREELERRKQENEEIRNRLNGGLAVDDDDYTIDLYNVRKVYVRNRIKFIKVRYGDTFESLTKELHLMPFQLYKYNELGKGTKLQPGQILYLQPKRKRASVNHKVHVVEAGETMYKISQMYGIKIKSLYKMNRMDEGNEIEEGQLLYLRGKKKEL